MFSSPLKRAMSSSMSSCYKNTKLVVILGSTAVGKTKLSIELAKMLNGEIISADSMQVYKGLDIITNKVTPEEKQSIPHHMIDIFDTTQEFTVIDFKQRALEVISDLAKRQKVPIIVGGTNYFIEALLWDFLIEGGLDDVDPKTELRNRKAFLFPGSKRKHEEDEEEVSNVSGEPLDSLKSEKNPGERREGIAETELYDELMKVDPERANHLHPNNIRKISRSLQIYHITGVTHSSLMKKQQNQPGSSKLSGPLRFPNSLLLWLTAEQTILNQRISTRVDQMLDNGLDNEIRTFYQKHLKATENCRVKIREPETQSQLNSYGVAKSDDNVAKSDDNVAKSDDSVEKPDDNVAKSNDNVAKSDDNVAKTVDNVKIPDDDDFQVKDLALEPNKDYSATTESQKGDETNVDTIEAKELKPKEDSLLKSYEEGIFQAIGFKEFHKYLTYSGRDGLEKGKLLQASLEKLKQITIKYSKKQVRWVTNRIVKRQPENSLPVYNLDASDIEAWDEHVLEKAKEITQCFMRDEPITHAPMTISDDADVTVTELDKHRKHVCEDCNGRIIIGDDAWEVHLKSKKHRKIKASRARKMQTSAEIL